VIVGISSGEKAGIQENTMYDERPSGYSEKPFVYQERRPEIPTFLQIILVIVVLGIVSVGGYTAYHFQQGPPPSSHFMPTNTAVVTAIQRIDKLETTTDTLQQVIVYDPHYVLGDAQKLFVVYGTVTAGIDLSTLNKNDVQIQGQSVTLNAPAAQILSANVDPAQTQVYDANTGIYSIISPKLDSNTTNAIMAKAQNTLSGDACANGILQQASDSAKGQLTALLTTLGFTSVIVNTSAGTCS
jgi:Protein of unknown function (DUF4230)